MTDKELDKLNEDSKFIFDAVERQLY
jgi:hypothetical protein